MVVLICACDVCEEEEAVIRIDGRCYCEFCVPQKWQRQANRNRKIMEQRGEA